MTPPIKFYVALVNLILIVVAQDTTILPEPTVEPVSTTVGPSTPIPYSVEVIASNVPSVQYNFDAVGILQVYLEQVNSMQLALPMFLTSFRERHDTQSWKLASSCGFLKLANDTLFISLRETATGTDINLFV